MLTGPKRSKYLRAQMDLDRQTNGETEESERLGSCQQVFLVALVRFPNPLAFGSGLGERTPKKAIFQLRRPVV